MALKLDQILKQKQAAQLLEKTTQEQAKAPLFSVEENQNVSSQKSLSSPYSSPVSSSSSRTQKQLSGPQSLTPKKSLSISQKNCITQPHQLRALQLAKTFGDEKNKIQYLNLCKSVHPAIIDQAYSFVADANAQNKAALFMWKIKQIKNNWIDQGKNWHNPDKPPTNRRKIRQKSKKPVSIPNLFD